jgi:nucleoside-diphosphate-sugar epimerase
VDDLIEGLYRLLTYQPHKPNEPNEPLIFNLGNPDEVTILQVAREVIEMTGSRSEVTFRSLPPDDPKVRRPDITKAKERLGWGPRVSRAEGLKQTIAYFQSLLGGVSGVRC